MRISQSAITKYRCFYQGFVHEDLIFLCYLLIEQTFIRLYAIKYIISGRILVGLFGSGICQMLLWATKLSTDSQWRFLLADGSFRGWLNNWRFQH